MAPDHVDHYRTLQVDPAAELDVIHAAYRVLARKAHPDLAGDAAVMIRLNVAWDVLRDADRREAYDRERSAAAAPLTNGSNGSNGAAAAPAAPAESVIFSAAPRYQADHAGPPPGDPFGPIMTYGRYEGWSLGEIARTDPAFLRWLSTVPSGRSLRRDIEAVLEEVENRPYHLGSRRRTYAR